MSPLLLDSRDLFRIGLVTIPIASVIFAGGFVFGFQKAEAVLVSGSSTAVLELPEKLETTLSDIEPRIPEIRAVGEYIDVDQPDTVSEQALETVEIAMQTTASVAEKPGSADEQAPASQDVSAQAETVPAVETQQEQVPVAGSPVAVTGPDTPAAPVLPSASELARAKYSIQVGMYGSLQNAENMVELLRAQGRQAYVSEYFNSKKELRYNVRFGFFEQKGQALSMLENYRSSQQGDGYLVRFSAESLARLSTATEPDQSADEPPASQSPQAGSAS